MKKFLSLICIIACVFGLTACGGSEELTVYEQTKTNEAMSKAVEVIIPSLDYFMGDGGAEALSEYTAEEVSTLVYSQLGYSVDGNAFVSAIKSFNDAYKEIGGRVSFGEITADIDDKQIIVHVGIQGQESAAEAELIFTNDMFLDLESAALNPTQTMGQLMGNAALNTLIGMGTVFVVLILISFIISAFGVIPKIQAAMSGKKKAEQEKAAPAATPAPVAVQEAEDVSDDLELVAVIAAAIAASEGAASTDGFVVRTIRRRYI